MYFDTNYSEKDVTVLTWQLKRDNIFIEGVVSRCPWGYPRVVLLSPFQKTEGSGGGTVNFIALSTPLWLTCPYLNDKIHKLEDLGYIKRIEGLIQGEKQYLKGMKSAHVHYAFLRKKLWRQFIGEPEIIEPNCKLMTSGIGGIRAFETVKCLHLHYAHYTIFPDNYVGRVITTLLRDDTHCREGTCGNAVLEE